MRRERLIDAIAAFTRELVAMQDRPNPGRIDGNSILFGVDGLLDSFLFAQLLSRLEDCFKGEDLHFPKIGDTKLSADNPACRTIGNFADCLLASQKNPPSAAPAATREKQ